MERFLPERTTERTTERATSPEKYITPRTLRSYTADERKIILNVYGVLRRENPEMPRVNMATRAGELTGVSGAAVERLRKEFDTETTQEQGKKAAQVDLSTQIDKEAIEKAYMEVRQDTSETEWLVLKYDGTRVVCSRKGNSFDKFKEEFGDNDRAYGYIRVQMGDEMSKRQKFLLVAWVGEGVGVIKRAKMSTDKALVKNILSNFSVELQIENKSDLDIDFFKEQLCRAGGANYGTGVRDL